uniref:Uncharacterized protein n=4 Tax=Avena sativa TaxID=4498 RepID=A0ACD5ZEH7_AVESA
MSLHIGGLSSAVRKQYLQHVFQRFGRCTVRMKEGYGFAVFDASDDAARALQELHGTLVCGKRITVNWSKHQPDLSRSYSRSSRRIGPSNGRASRDGAGRFRLSDLADQKNDYTGQDVHQNPDDGVEKKNHHTSHDKSHNPDDVVEKNSDEIAEGLEDVGENIGEDPAELKMDEEGTSGANPIEHDRWGESGIGNHGGDDDDFDRFEPYHGYIKQEEKEQIAKEDHRRFPKKWQEHPAERFDQKHGKSRSLPTCSSCGTAGHIAGNCPEETVGKFRALGDGSSLREKGELRLRKSRYPSTRRPESHVDPMIQAHERVQDIRRPFPERTGRAPKLSNVRRMNRRHTPQSENTPQVPKEAHNGGKLKRSREPSHSSGRTSSYSRSRSPRPRSRAQSPSHSAHSSSKSSQPTQPEGFKLVPRSNVSHHCGPLSVSVAPSAAGNINSGVLANSPLASNLDLKARSSELKRMDDGYKQEVKGSNLDCEVPSTSSKLDTQISGDLPVPGKDVKAAVDAETYIDEDMVDDTVADGVVGETTSAEDTSSGKPNKERLVRSISLKLTTSEVVSALKHYGMEARGEVGLGNQHVEAYFGAARLWPWQIIYYRRCKKGPISTENYARRVEQNKEFGIVDRYVRSSSGWWERR